MCYKHIRGSQQKAVKQVNKRQDSIPIFVFYILNRKFRECDTEQRSPTNEHEIEKT